MIHRREFLKTSALTATALAMGPDYWRQALAQKPATPGPGPYGPPGAADSYGVSVPAGFKNRLIASSSLPVEGTGYLWPLFPDGKATYKQPDGGWVLCVNSEIPLIGGASSITFDRNGEITGARRILSGTNTNCGGGRLRGGRGCPARRSTTGASGNAIRSARRPLSFVRRSASSSTRPPSSIPWASAST